MNAYIGDKKGITNSSKAKPACAINLCSYLLLVGITQVHLGINILNMYPQEKENLITWPKIKAVIKWPNSWRMIASIG